MLPGLYDVWPNLMLASGIGLLCWALMRRGPHTWSRRRPEADASIEPPHGSPSIASEVHRRKMELEDAIMRWEVRMHDMTRDVSGELETKISVMQRLILMAHEQQEQLSQLLARCEQVPSLRIPDVRASVKPLSVPAANATPDDHKSIPDSRTTI